MDCRRGLYAPITRKPPALDATPGCQPSQRRHRAGGHGRDLFGCGGIKSRADVQRGVIAGSAVHSRHRQRSGIATAGNLVVHVHLDQGDRDAPDDLLDGVVHVHPGGLRKGDHIHDTCAHPHGHLTAAHSSRSGDQEAAGRRSKSQEKEKKNTRGTGSVSKPNVKALTRAQRLAAALEACHKKGRKHRMVCERRARRAYGPLHKKK